MAKFKYVAYVTGKGEPVIKEVKIGTKKGECAKGKGLCNEHLTLKQWEARGGAKNSLTNSDSYNDSFDDSDSFTLTEYNNKSHECDLPSRGSRFVCKECGKSYYSAGAGEADIRSWYENEHDGEHICKTPSTMFKKSGYIHTCKQCGQKLQLSFESGGGEGGGYTIHWDEV